MQKDSAPSEIEPSQSFLKTFLELSQKLMLDDKVDF